MHVVENVLSMRKPSQPKWLAGHEVVSDKLQAIQFRISRGFFLPYQEFACEMNRGSLVGERDNAGDS